MSTADPLGGGYVEAPQDRAGGQATELIGAKSTKLVAQSRRIQAAGAGADRGVRASVAA